MHAHSSTSPAQTPRSAALPQLENVDTSDRLIRFLWCCRRLRDVSAGQSDGVPATVHSGRFVPVPITVRRNRHVGFQKPRILSLASRSVGLDMAPSSLPAYGTPAKTPVTDVDRARCVPRRQIQMVTCHDGSRDREVGCEVCELTAVHAQIASFVRLWQDQHKGPMCCRRLLAAGQNATPRVPSPSRSSTSCTLRRTCEGPMKRQPQLLVEINTKTSD